MRVKTWAVTGMTLFVAMLLALAWPPPGAQADEPRAWTVLVYLCADNNLDELGLDNLREMAAAGSTGERAIVALLDRFQAPATEYVIAGNQAVVLRERGELDMGDPDVLTGFVRESIARFPARHYALILFNHGTGWRSRENAWRGIAFDDSSGNHLTTSELQASMADIAGHLGRKLDLLGFDACLMQMMEVAYAVRNTVDHVVGSEELEPQYGYPYDSILKALTPDLSPPDLARTVVRKYENFYTARSSREPLRVPEDHRDPEGTTQSAILCSRLEGLRTRLDAVCSSLMQGDHAHRVREAMARTQRFCASNHADLGDFLATLRDTHPTGDLEAAIDAALLALGETVLANGVTQSEVSRDGSAARRATVTHRGDRAFRATGLAIFLPQQATALPADYQDLAWSQDSLWEPMLRDFFRKEEAATIVDELREGRADRLQALLNGLGGTKGPCDPGVPSDPNDPRGPCGGGSRIAREVLDAVRFAVFCEHLPTMPFREEIRRLLAPGLSTAGSPPANGRAPSRP